MTADSNDKIRAALLNGLLSPWFALAFLAGLIVGYAIGRLGI